MIDGETAGIERAKFPHSPAKDGRKTDNLRVYNLSSEGFASVEVARFDATAEPLRRLFDYLASGSYPGLWLKPYRGLPVMPGANTFDLVYLDGDCKVTERLDKYPNPQGAISSDELASAVLLPAHSAFVSQISIGDEFVICEAAEFEQMLAARSASTDGDSSTTTDVVAGIPPRNASSRLTTPAATPMLRKKLSLVERMKRWFSSEASSLQRVRRHPLPGLIAYHWSGGTPQPCALGDISGTGFYLLTDERPYPGTLLKITLQRVGTDNERLQDSVAVYSKVVRCGPDGVGFAFVPIDGKGAKNTETDHQVGDLADRHALDMFLKRAAVHEDK